MSEIKYGLISKVDASVIERTLDLIFDQIEHDTTYVTEIGLYSGDTGNGIREYAKAKAITVHLTGIDNFKDQQPILRTNRYDDLLQGNSNEVYNQLEDESQHLIFVDGCHCFAHVVSDFFCYAPKVKKGGFIAFHDTGRHIKPFKDFQHGDKENPGAYISVREALEAIGLGVKVIDAKTLQVFYLNPRWQLIFDEADPNDEAGGITVFKRL